MKYLALIYGDASRWDAFSDDEKESMYATYRAFADQAYALAEAKGKQEAEQVRIRLAQERERRKQAEDQAKKNQELYESALKLAQQLGSFEKVLRFGEGKRLKRLAQQAAYIDSIRPVMRRSGLRFPERSELPLELPPQVDLKVDAGAGA